MKVQLVNGDLPLPALEAALKASTVGMDIETSGLNKETDRLAMIQLFIPTYGTIMLRHVDEWPTRLATLLENERTTKIFHHAVFDLAFLMRDFPFIYPSKIADTKIAAAFFDPKKTYFGRHSLSVMVEKVFGFVMDKSIAVSDWFVDELTPEQLDYAAKDVEYLPELLRFLERGIMNKDRGLIGPLMQSYHYIPTRVITDSKVGRDVFMY